MLGLFLNDASWANPFCLLSIRLFWGHRLRVGFFKDSQLFLRLPFYWFLGSQVTFRHFFDFHNLLLFWLDFRSTFLFLNALQTLLRLFFRLIVYSKFLQTFVGRANLLIATALVRDVGLHVWHSNFLVSLAALTRGGFLILGRLLLVRLRHVGTSPWLLRFLLKVGIAGFAGFFRLL